MKVVAVIGTYRKGGNTDIIIDKVLEGARTKGAETEKIFIDDLTVKSCQGCMDECRTEGICKIEDDLKIIIDKIDQSDAVIIGSPVYGNYMTGQLKILLDRLMYTINQTRYVNGKRNTASRLTPKKRNLLTIMTAGAPNKDCADDALKLTRRMLSTLTNGGFMKELIAVNINAKGQILWDLEKLTQAARMLGKGPEAAAQLKKDNEEVLQEAYNIGAEMAE